MTICSAIAVYVFGIMLASVITGALMKPIKYFDNFDFTLFIVTVLIWPVLLVLGIVIVLVVGVFFFIIIKPIQFLMYFGQNLGNQYEEWRKVRKMKECDND